MAATVRNKIEKQITRMYEDGIERAVSVVSKDVAHLPGNILNANDIMFNPGKNVIDIIKVYDNLVAITPYSILLKSGNGNQHNTKEYKLDYSMMGNYHYICHDNKNTIMHAAYDNNIVQFIKLLPDGGIKEYNVAPAKDETIINACCVHQMFGKYCWWVFTKTKVYYCNDYDFETWESFSYNVSSYADQIKEQKPLISYWIDSSNPATVGNIFFVSFKVGTVSLLLLRSNAIKEKTQYPYPVGASVKSSELASNCLLMSDVSVYSNTVSTNQSRITEFYNSNNTLYIRILNMTVNTETLAYGYNKYVAGASLGISISDNDMLVYFPSEYRVYDTQGKERSAVWRVGQLYVFKYDEDTDKINPNGTAYKIYMESSTTPAIEKSYDVELRNSDFKIFNTMPHSIFTATRRDVGDEIFNTTKAVYYNNGTTEFYVKDKLRSGFLYRYMDTTVNASNEESNGNTYYLRNKIDVTNKFEGIKDDDEDTNTYIGTGGVSVTFTFSTQKKIPKFIFVKDISGSTVGNKYGWAYLLPKENYGIVQAGTFTGPHIKLIDDGSATASFKVDESTYTVQIQFNNSAVADGSCCVNMSGHTYRWYAKF